MNKTITFITGNKNKLQEVIQIFGLDSSYTIQSLNLDLPEIQGEPETIVAEKCRLASLEIDGPVLVEDTSLGFNALCGLPGPYIKWFQDKIGLEGLNNLLVAYEDKTAVAKCIFAYRENRENRENSGENKIHIFTGLTNGKIVPSQGSIKFGWDPIFMPEGYTETFAEMEKEVKNTISHRYKALQLFKAFLEGGG